jgi:hypothetical protein
MQITLFKALRSLKLNDDDATAVVESLEQHVERMVNNHIAAMEGKLTALEGKLTGLQTSIDAMRSQLNFVGVMIGIVGLAIAAAPLVARFVR